MRLLIKNWYYSKLLLKVCETQVKDKVSGHLYNIAAEQRLKFRDLTRENFPEIGPRYFIQYML